MQVYREITPVRETDILVVIDSVCNGFKYPIHNHPEYEINLVMNMSGTRIVGDSTERYSDYDLALLGPYLYHKWDGDEHLQNSDNHYRVITIQFGVDLFNSHFLKRDKFVKIKKLLQDSARGIKFYGNTVSDAIHLFETLTNDSGFSNFIVFLQLLDLLSTSNEKAFLASEGFVTQKNFNDSDQYRVLTAYHYILKNFTDANLRLSDLSALLKMSDSAFSHFFYKNTNKSFTKFLVDVRLGNACKRLLDTDDTIKQICFDSGFNNLTNFNRLFKKYKFCTPKEYKEKFGLNSSFDWSTQVTPWQFNPISSDNSKITPTTYATKVIHI